MVRRFVFMIVLLASASPAAAARHDIATATPTDGAAPLQVTFTAGSSVHWDFGDGTSQTGQRVTHVYAAGRWTATWTSGDGSGSITITAHAIELKAPARVRYRSRVALHGTLIPADGGVPVRVSNGTTTATTVSQPDGTFTVHARLLRGGAWTAATNFVTTSVDIAVIPQLHTTLVGSGARGSRFVFAASVRPPDAGRITVTIERAGNTLVDDTFGSQVRIRLDTRQVTTYLIRARLEPAPGFTSAVQVVRAHVVLPQLALGTHGAAVFQLADRLRALHYAAPYTAAFDDRMLESVYAFEKVQALPRTGVVGPGFWQRLADPRIPVPRYASPSDHIEIDKPHQVLYVVRGSRVSLIIPVSTAGLPGRFTPVGRFAIYRKVTGFDPSPLGTLFDPMYFTGGYAIHGNPSVPPYPASHGCVRVPMWIAPYLYATNPYSETVYVY